MTEFSKTNLDNNRSPLDKKTLDLSKKGLLKFPVETVCNIEFVKCCYLQDNEISALPSNFFLLMPNVEYLDLRNNNLVELPTEGLSGHSNLQFLLLQSNLIKNLPYELGELANIKGLQIAGNPIENVPVEVISKGLPSILEHLRKMKPSDTIIQPVSQSSIKSTGKSGSKGSTASTEQKKMKCFSPSTTKKILLHTSFSVKRAQSNHCEKYFKCHTTDSRKNVTGRRSNRRYPKLVTAEEVFEAETLEAEKNRLKETLEIQNKLLQRFKNAEALKLWRKSMEKQSKKLLDNYQYSPSSNFIDKSPFDVDKDMLKMLGRSDLYLPLAEWEERCKKSVLATRRKNILCDVKQQMEAIKSRLDAIIIKEKSELANKDKQYMKVSLASRIEEINKLRDTLKHLNSQNMKKLA